MDFRDRFQELFLIRSNTLKFYFRMYIWSKIICFGFDFIEFCLQVLYSKAGNSETTLTLLIISMGFILLDIAYPLTVLKIDFDLPNDLRVLTRPLVGLKAEKVPEKYTKKASLRKKK